MCLYIKKWLRAMKMNLPMTTLTSLWLHLMKVCVFPLEKFTHLLRLKIIFLTYHVVSFPIQDHLTYNNVFESHEVFISSITDELTTFSEAIAQPIWKKATRNFLLLTTIIHGILSNYLKEKGLSVPDGYTKPSIVVMELLRDRRQD